MQMRQKSVETQQEAWTRIACSENRNGAVLRGSEESEAILCSVCFKPINQNDPLEFGGSSLACEPCIRAYYKEQWAAVFPSRNAEEFESFLRVELRSRRYCGPRILKQILKAQEKRTRSFERRWKR